jgi:hypothetical protein
VGVAEIPFLGPPHVGLALSSHSANTTTINVTSVENLPPTTFDELQVIIYSGDNTNFPYFGHDVSRVWPANVSYVDADANGAFSAGDQLVVALDASTAGHQTGGRLEVFFFLNTVGVLSPLP